MIDSKLPVDWKDLQNKVAEIFTDIGYETKIDKPIKTVRSVVRIDVLAKDQSQTPEIIYLCECKYWNKKIPQAIINEFRTVVQDFGANYGIIISKNGFQKGALLAARYTNIKLVDWFGFQDIFEEKWLPAVSLKLYSKYQRLVDYTEYLAADLFKKAEKLGRDKLESFVKLREKYMLVGYSILNFHFGRHWSKEKQILKVCYMVIPGKEPEKIKPKSWREYVNYLEFYGKEGQKEFDKIFQD